MLNRTSMPVWMLADALLVLLVSGGLVTSSVVLPFLSCWISQDELRQLRDEAQQLPEIEHTVHERDKEIAQLRETVDAANKSVNDKTELLVKYRVAYTTLVTRISREKQVRQKMLGLRGSMDRTLFVIDISGSMNEAPARPMDRPNWGTDGKPWTFVCNQVGTWLELLPVKSFRVICFDHSIQEFPDVKDGWVSSSAARDAVRRFLADTEPKGLTMTENALRRAIEWQPTSIILFTDGAPTDEDGNFDPQQIERLLDEDLPPINVVAVNNYFDQQLGSLLHRLAARSQGSFIGL